MIRKFKVALAPLVTGVALSLQFTLPTRASNVMVNFLFFAEFSAEQ